MKDTQSPQSVSVDVKPLASSPAEQQAVDEILLLLEQLAQQESATAKLILDRLYDIGSVNLINRKVKPRSLNRISHAIAARTKPIFRFFSSRWFQGNCPQLITDWLYEQVKVQPVVAAQEIIETHSLPNSPSAPDHDALEIRKLRTQLRWRTGLLGGSLGVLSAVIVFNITGLFPSPNLVSPQPSPPTAQQLSP